MARTDDFFKTLYSNTLQGKLKEQGLFAQTGVNSLTQAFPKKYAVHAGMSGTPVAQSKMPELLATLRDQERHGASAAYVHIPYCESKCLYCGFFGGKYTPAKGAGYLDSLLWEIEAEGQYRSTGIAPIHALYLGGGTPTALAAKELSLLLKTLRQHLPLANDCEITVEGRVHNFGEEKMEACLEAGANRFSLGVQTFNTKLRQMLGRIESKESVIKQLEKLASYNQAAVVIDLIYGLPGQSLDDWKNDIRTFLDLPLDGVDLYQLNVFPGSALEKAITQGNVPPTVPLNEQGAYFTEGVALMQSARCTRLSISHWGRSTRERNVYNPLAKNRSDCLHFGVRSGGALHGYFTANEFTPEVYLERCRRQEKPISMMMEPPACLPLVRAVLSQMEMCRLNLKKLSAALAQTPLAESTTDAATFFGPLLENWQDAGLAEQDGEWIELTLAGQFWQANLTHALLGWQNTMYKEYSICAS